ncbi:hypothetical protein [Clostridium cellulovorans]|uniref:Uncharacterized protein n=1 Tax=Clostridium cellulovorans (strain ATCC 35296 / DSM 3052 / OCM 3 / 743B) TaxID=573061 RepID=D9SVE0_CLOC7|nr:hypothetical protein [Clostridium cellulovorans]ADL51064.1 hypothetical protein Clocel_1310 [Clostridium cellulovorans 743B]
MKLEQVFKQWGYEVSDEFRDFDYLCSREPEKCFYIDRFPQLINDFNKYQQEEMFYEQVKNNKISEKRFYAEELKFINILKKLWLYNSVIGETNFCEIEDKIIKEALNYGSDNNMNLFKDKLMRGKEQSFTLEENNLLEIIAKLGVRECVYSTLIFLDYKIVINVYSMCFQVYIDDLSKLSLIREVICTEGLYLRSYII